MVEGIFKERQVKIWSDTKDFLRVLDRKIKEDTFFNFKLANETEKYNLRRKLLAYFSNARIPKTEQNLSSLHDSILSLGLPENTETRKKFLGEGNNGMSIKHLLDWHHRQSITKLGQEAKEKAEEGFETLYRSGDYKLTKVVGTNEQKRLGFQSIGADLPGNCLGRSHTDYYLQKKDTDILVLKDQGNKNIVAIEYNNKTRTFLQIEGNKPKGEGRIPATAPYINAFLTFVTQMVKEKKLATLNGINHLENVGILQGKVITKSGEIRLKEEVEENEILFPTPIFGEIINVEYPPESKTAPQDFLKPRDPKKGRVDATKLLRLQSPYEQKYVEAGIYQWSKIFEEVKVENGNSPLITLKSLELQKSANDTQIASRLGIQCQPDGSMTPQQEEANKGKIFTLKEIQTLMEMQMGFDKEGNIKEGYLKNDGNWNIFYVKGSDNKLRSFCCNWRSDDREWDVGSFRFGLEWIDGNRVFSRN